jgi:tripartite-type tricarboxylate transporter receptor subunit TctC
MTRIVSALAIGLLALLGATPGNAQTYPDHPVRIVVPFGAGGQSDILSRILAQELSLALGQTFVVDDRPGAGGNIGAESVAKARPDGYTLLLLSNGILAVNPALYRDTPFDPVKDLRVLNVFCTTSFVMMVSGKSPIHTVQDFVARAKAAPGTMNFGSAGVGTFTHLAGELFRSRAGIAIEHVPYKGSAEAEAALAADQVQAVFDSIVAGAPFDSAGTLRALAVTDRVRSSALPNVPTMAEAGFAGVEAIAWLSIAAPAQTPPAVADLLAAKIAEIVQKPAVQKKFQEVGVQPVAWSKAETDDSIRQEMAKWPVLIRQAKIAPNP